MKPDAVIGLLAFCACACTGATRQQGSELRGVVDGFHHDLRWKYYDAAAAAVEPRHAAAFLDEVENQKDALNITNWEIRQVEVAPGSEQANIRVRFDFYKMPSTSVVTRTAAQVWKKLEDRWFLVSQENGPFSFPPRAPGAAGPEGSSDGSARDEPSP